MKCLAKSRSYSPAFHDGARRGFHGLGFRELHRGFANGFAGGEYEGMSDAYDDHIIDLRSRDHASHYTI